MYVIQNGRGAPAPRHATLFTIPEELLERILSICINTPPHPTAVPPTALPLVSKRFARIATPLLYHTVRLREPDQARRLYRALYEARFLCQFVRKLEVRSAEAYAGACEIVDFVRAGTSGMIGIEEVDLMLGGDVSRSVSPEAGAMNICEALARLHGVKRLTLRKPANVYLTHDQPRLMLEGLAAVVKNWRHLETLTFAFRISSTPSIDLLIAALAKSPRLHTIRAVTPVVWNPCLAQISTNPAVQKIEMLSDESSASPVAMSSTGLFLKEAKKCERLWTLIRRGTPTLRARANTYSSVPSSAPTPAYSTYRAYPPSQHPPPSQLKAAQSMGTLSSHSHYSQGYHQQQYPNQYQYQQPQDKEAMGKHLASSLYASQAGVASGRRGTR